MKVKLVTKGRDLDMIVLNDKGKVIKEESFTYDEIGSMGIGAVEQAVESICEKLGIKVERDEAFE
jgi:hypothetical protein